LNNFFFNFFFIKVKSTRIILFKTTKSTRIEYLHLSISGLNLATTRLIVDEKLNQGIIPKKFAGLVCINDADNLAENGKHGFSAREEKLITLLYGFILPRNNFLIYLIDELVQNMTCSVIIDHCNIIIRKYVIIRRLNLKGSHMYFHSMNCCLDPTFGSQPVESA
jgi:hypothetical protein